MRSARRHEACPRTKTCSATEAQATGWGGWSGRGSGGREQGPGQGDVIRAECVHAHSGEALHRGGAVDRPGDHTSPLGVGGADAVDVFFVTDRDGAPLNDARVAALRVTVLSALQ